MDIWTDLTKRGAEAVRELCSKKIPEGQRLEFKQKSRVEQADLNRDDRKALGESLSAMSNAVGGVIIFGVVDSKDEDGLDYAKEPQLLKNVSAIAGKIESLVPEYLSPPNQNIEVLPILLEENSGSGIVAVRVGSSDLRPHMSMAPGHWKYYLRAGASNKPMADFQVRDMLRIITTPSLSLGYLMRCGVISAGEYQSNLILTLINDGKISVNQPYTMIHESTNVHVVGPGSEQFKMLSLANVAEQGFQGTGQFALHPGQEIPTAAFLAHVKKVGDETCFRMNAAQKDFLPLDECSPVQIKVSIGCEHVEARQIEFGIDNEELAEMGEKILERQTYQGARRF